jgi:hypothetical protein
MVKIKSGVTPAHLIILAAIANVAEQWNRTVTVTSGTDGRHMAGSRHYKSAALDVRSKDFEPEDKPLFIRAVLHRLGPDYQGILEQAGQPNEHFHFELDRLPAIMQPGETRKA